MIIYIKRGTLEEITDYKIILNDSSSKKGDSYLSTICRFSITASGKNQKGTHKEVYIPVIVKYFPKNIARRKTFRSVDFFKTEIYFYEQIWPEMKKFKQSKIPDEIDEVPLHLYSWIDGKHDFIALKDLSYDGFKASGRDESFSVGTVCSFLELLAKFHALSLALKQSDPNFAKKAAKLEESYFSEKFECWYKNFMYNSMGPHYQKATKNLLPEMYFEKITNFFKRDLYGDVCKACRVGNKYSCVTEGDCWLPNFLSKMNEGKLVAVLIDFQLARYSTFTNDLIHFLYSGVPSDMLLKEWDNLVAHYHRSLCSRIEELGGGKNFITLYELQECMQKHALVGVVMALESSLMALLNDDEVADIDFLEGEDAVPLEDVWILPEFQKDRNEKLAFLVKHCVDKGFIP
ncbi:hypothetical protein GWI33_019444 [Rhynchophorus ferrugineus]|uniref:CHK kinase-like domain-containing protein n=1 Tax=Rhynchophorus ferrugineus TaxID=354439 RepID=A0A834HYB6_RHYFE|nr:hypothetical protein GWI33_019444 [Rhynchophorus ferrugineus]